MKLSARTPRLRARISRLDDQRCRLTLDYPDEAAYERAILALVTHILTDSEALDPVPDAPPLVLAATP